MEIDIVSVIGHMQLFGEDRSLSGSLRRVSPKQLHEAKRSKRDNVNFFVSLIHLSSVRSAL